MTKQSIHSQTEHEGLLAGHLRTVAVERISELDPGDVQASLNLARSGLERLLAQTNWDLPTAFRVADCLQLPVVGTLLTTVQELGEQTVILE